MDVLLVELSGQRLALPAAAVEGVLRMVSLAPAPGASRAVEGLLDLHGRAVPVFDLRRRLALPPREPRPEDHLVLVRLPRGLVALRVDRALELAAATRVEPAAAAGAVGEGGIVRVPSGLAVLQAPEALLDGTPGEA